MTWTFTDDVDVFLDAAGASLAARPAENTLVLTVTAALRRGGPHAYTDSAPLLGWWRGADGEVAGTLVQTPPYRPLLGTVAPEALAPLAAALPLTGVNADRATAEALAATWPGHRVDQEQRLYRLETLVPPSPAPAGRHRAATAADREPLVRWFHAFADQVGQPGKNAERLVDEGTAAGTLTLWEDGGVPVSMAGASPRIAGTVRIATVYTPAEYRGRGYAAAVTAEVARAAREAGAQEVLLFTDLANPTSNGVYRRIGFRAVSDRLLISAAEEPVTPG
ncbi:MULTISPECIES: GNAT family N-acetyltransferase [unclassified Streptomyces]|uniref:GNAT family N-acetyltransferase n=1 Tax=unclassified Streptomyces TaxID=2593676 RepID=UPI0022516B78|nr:MULTISPECIES: GNAT family N-acetyltransferase [unclassified Streptomyces]WSP58248.1 GNAT family N-acetyltransferase [Streptomyces sp. NBC_01241]WSU21174.1 GNAT family N-acetyltransferase [Streptomyces sp. NBC_01108]MCX4789995.1 GNAT family N-acetyltransferase [Streptomyces sp. NBC_01221]MCX4794278.1 GNAT family N-acetyltransferase [Streptomyces sp. NBC_01242]WSJ35668.1 GNAT family N-acetyltransferase [Streptomyces sp. NBC_01321]